MPNFFELPGKSLAATKPSDEIIQKPSIRQGTDQILSMMRANEIANAVKLPITENQEEVKEDFDVVE